MAGNSNQNLVGGLVSSLIGAAPGGGLLKLGSSIVGSLLKKEDTSLAGWTSFMNIRTFTGPFPPLSELVKAGQIAGWPADDIAAIQKTYDVSTGTASKGDWRMAVMGTMPISVKWFKGAQENFSRASTYTWQSTQPATNILGRGTGVKNATQSQGSEAQRAAFVNDRQQPGKSNIPTWVKWGAGILAVVVLVIGFMFKKKR